MLRWYSISILLVFVCAVLKDWALGTGQWAGGQWHAIASHLSKIRNKDCSQTMDGGRGLLPPVFPNLSIPDSANSRYSSFVIFSTVLSIFRALRFHLGYQRERQRECPPRLYQSRDSIPRFHVLYDDIFYSMYQSWAPASRFALTRH